MGLALGILFDLLGSIVSASGLFLVLLLLLGACLFPGSVRLIVPVEIYLPFSLFSGGLKADVGPDCISPPGIGFGIGFDLFVSFTSFLKSSRPVSENAAGNKSGVFVSPVVLFPSRIISSWDFVRMLSRIWVASDDILAVAAC